MRKAFKKMLPENVKKIYRILLLRIYHYGYRFKVIPKKGKEDLRHYWESPTDSGNKPEGYAQVGKERSDFLVNLVKKLNPQPASILEIGCNVGRNLQYLLNAGYPNLTGIEISNQALEALKRYFPDLSGVAKTINLPVELALPQFQDGSFDLVFTLAVLEHVHPEEDGIFREINRITRNHLITIEDERHQSERHFPRNYKKIFTKLDFREIVSYRGNKMVDIGLDRNFIARVFNKVN